MQTEGPKYTGEPSLEALANGLGTLGRYGDDYMVHAAHGETVIPAEILAANPQLKHDLFRQMRMMGIKNPNRYVVGNALNSINPLTGQPEFFFKKIFRSLRKVWKKVAPIVVPIIGNMIAPGIGGPIASALMTKVQGGNWGDALKSAAMSYGAQALGSGIKSLAQSGKFFTGADSMWGGLKAGVLSPFEAAGNLFSSGPANPLAQGIFGPRGAGLIFDSAAGDLGKSFSPSGASWGRRAVDTMFPTYQSGMPTTPTHDIRGADQYARVTGPERVVTEGSGYGRQTVPKTDYGAYPGGGQGQGDMARQNVTYTDRGIPTNEAGTGIGDEFKTTGPDTSKYVDDVYHAQGVPEVKTGPNMLERTIGDKAANVLYKGAEQAIGPVALAGLTYYMSDDEDEPSEEDIAKMTDPQQEAWQRYNAQRGRDDWDTWRTSDEARGILREAGIYGPQYELADISNITGVPTSQIDPWNMYGASGGIASLQGGGEVEGPGTGTSDSIPARLSDGEFVMTAEAVRNAGKGDRNLGAARMYDLMHRFEGAPV